MPTLGTNAPRILILALHHGATHFRIGRTLEKALRALQPKVQVEVIDALEYCAPWFRAYYNSYEIPLRYLPELWDAIERRQFEGGQSGPWWMYRRASRPLRRYIEGFRPHVVVGTEVGLGEMAMIHKREFGARYALVAAQTFAFERPWAQPEVDLFISHPGKPTEDLRKLGVPEDKIFAHGVLIEPEFRPSMSRAELRANLGLQNELPVFLVNFGGSGKTGPQDLVAELKTVPGPFQTVFITRRNEDLKRDVLQLTQDTPHVTVLGWVDNMHEWMAAADLLLSRAGGGIVAESLNCGLPILVFDAPPGNERRICSMIEDVWHSGYQVRATGDLSRHIIRLLADPVALAELRENALRQACPDASREAAEAVLNLAARSR